MTAPLDKLHDFYQPPAPSWTPQTIGWYVVFAVVGVLVLWAVVYFVRKWMRSLLKKQAVWPGHYDFHEIGRLADLRRMTAELIRRFTEFPSLDDYLNGYSITEGRLAKLEVPATIITSLDDPIIPAHSLARLASPPSLHLTVTRFGGHCGFLDRLTGPSWVEQRMVEELDSGHARGEWGSVLTSA